MVKTQHKYNIFVEFQSVFVEKLNANIYIIYIYMTHKKYEHIFHGRSLVFIQSKKINDRR